MYVGEIWWLCLFIPTGIVVTVEILKENYDKRKRRRNHRRTVDYTRSARQ